MMDQSVHYIPLIKHAHFGFMRFMEFCYVLKFIVFWRNMRQKNESGETYPIRLQSQSTATIGNEKYFPYTATVWFIGTKNECADKYSYI